MGKSVTRLKDIALQTGFSVNTVSLALRDSPRITKDTRELITKAANELNYLPNQVAQSLVRQETRSIGLILTDLTNPVLTAVAQAVELELSKRGYTTLFATSNHNIDIEQQMIETFRARRADGMLIFPCNHQELDHIRTLRARNYPVVLLVADPQASIDAVCIHEKVGAYKAVKHLIDMGHRKIGLIDNASDRGNSAKPDGYAMALSEAGIELDPRMMVEPRDASVEAGYLAIERLLAAQTGATAVFAANDSLALGALRYCAKFGVKVPETLAIIGFDNIEFGEFAITPISTINYEIERISALAIDRVLELIDCPDELPEPRTTQIEPDLVIRESTDKRLA